jgi:hypothetical protein
MQKWKRLWQKISPDIFIFMGVQQFQKSNNVWLFGSAGGNCRDGRIFGDLRGKSG